MSRCEQPSVTHLLFSDFLLENTNFMYSLELTKVFLFLVKKIKKKSLMKQSKRFRDKN